MNTQTTFESMGADSDPLLQGRQYRYARNGRPRYNRAKMIEAALEDALNGKSEDFSLIRGTIPVENLCLGYDIIGAVEVQEGVLLFSTNGVHSEIGLMQIQQPTESGITYRTVYNDQNDPNRRSNPYVRRTVGDTDGDRLHLRPGKLSGYSEYENELVQNIYWADSSNQKRTLNLYRFFMDGNINTPFHHTNQCGAVIGYPKHMSVHAMAEQPDATHPMLRFRQRIVGKLKTGVYRIVTRYKQGNVLSPFSPIGPKIFITDTPLEDPQDTQMTEAIRSNHHNRTMARRNGINSIEGIRWDLVDVDSRWEEIEVAYVWYETDTVHSEAYVFRRLKLYDDRSVVVDLVQNSPDSDVFYPITVEEITRTYQTVMSVGYTAEHQGRNWDANLRLMPDYRLDLSAVQKSQCYRYIRPDDTFEPRFEFIENKVTGRYDGDPLTNTAVTNSQFQLSRYSGRMDTFPIVEDYHNYKGQQVSAMLRGYFAGEPYEFAAVLIDRKGNRMLCDSLGTHVFPKQYENYPLNTLTHKAADGRYDIRIMGLTLSNIRIPLDRLYDEYGNLNISGLMIVRAKRVRRLKWQGLIFPTIMGQKCETKTQDDGWVKPLAFPYNNFRSGYSAVYRGDTHTYLQGWIGCNFKPSWFEFGQKSYNRQPAVSTPHIFNFHSPDILFNETLEDSEGDWLEHVGQVHQAYTTNAIQLAGDKTFNIYTKSYRTELLKFINPAADLLYQNLGRPAIGNRSRIKWAFRHTKAEDTLYEKFDTDYWQYDYQAQTDMYRGLLNTFDFPCFGIQQPGSVVLRAQDWNAVDLTETGLDNQSDEERDERSCSYRLVNWYGKADAPAVRQYFATNYYLPITPETLSELRLERDNQGKPTAYVVDSAEVFDGDCFRTLFDFSRIQSGLDECRENPHRAAAQFPDTACSHIAPIESVFNLDLRPGRKFAANASAVARTYCAGEDRQFTNGINIRQPEDWNYNRALLLEETFNFYAERPIDTKFIEHRPNGVMWSPKKLPGEEINRFRMKLPADYRDIEGNSGAITGLISAFDYLYYIRQNSFGAILANPFRFVPTDAGEVQVTSGDVFGGVRELAAYGTRYPESVWSWGDKFGFVDTTVRKIVGFSQAGRDLSSERTKIDDLTRALSMNVEGFAPNQVYRNIIAGLDRENSEVLYSFHGIDPRINDTLVWSVSDSAFTGFYDMLPHLYFSKGDYLFSVRHNSSSPIWLHNYGRHGHLYGQYRDMLLRFVVNPNAEVLKIFSNGFILGSESLTKRLAQLRHWTTDEMHTVPYVQLQSGQVRSVDDRFDYQKGQLAYPMAEWDWLDQKKDLKGYLLNVELIVRNSYAEADGLDLPVNITSFGTAYRIGYPNQF